jgi:hypothetical protein
MSRHQLQDGAAELMWLSAKWVEKEWERVVCQEHCIECVEAHLVQTHERFVNCAVPSHFEC